MSSGETKQDVNSAHKVTDDILIEEIKKRINDNKYMGNYVNNVDKGNGTGGPKDGLYHLVYDGEKLTPPNMNTGGYKTDYDAAQQIKKAWADKVNGIHNKMPSGDLSAPPESGQGRGRGRGRGQVRGRGRGAPTSTTGASSTTNTYKLPGDPEQMYHDGTNVFVVHKMSTFNKTNGKAMPSPERNNAMNNKIINEPRFKMKFFKNNEYYQITNVSHLQSGEIFVTFNKIP